MLTPSKSISLRLTLFEKSSGRFSLDYAVAWHNRAVVYHAHPVVYGLV